MTLPSRPIPTREGAGGARRQRRHQRIRGQAARLQEPGRRVGKTFKAASGRERIRPRPITIIGVVKDSRFRSVKLPLDPILFQKRTAARPTWSSASTAIRRRSARRSSGQWKQLHQRGAVHRQVQRGHHGRAVQGRGRAGEDFAAFALLSVIVGCLGLFGLAAFTAERRTKEIGIRKVLGARVRDIVRLLVWQFSKPVIVANLIAWPIAWWVMRGWLNGFDTGSLGPTPFLLAGGLALAIAVATVAGHAIRVARSNPIHALRYE
jgi:putative ABC transport system permease protein